MNYSKIQLIAMANGLIDNEGFAVCLETADYEYYYEGGNSENMECIARYKKGALNPTYFAENNDHRQRPISELIIQ